MKILCLCDSPTLTSGFARVAQNLFRRWSASGCEIDVWGIAFQGWDYKRHPYVNQFFPAGTGQQFDHWASQQRLSLFLAQLQSGGYTHVWIMQDTFQLVNFNFPVALKRVCAAKNIRSLYYFPVDAPLDPEWTDIIAAVDVAVAYTEYGALEAKKKLVERAFQIDRHNAQCDVEKKPAEKVDHTGLNFGAEIHVLPHGVDGTLYHPIADRAGPREKFWRVPFAGPDDFVMVNVNVNQRRKDVARSLEVLQAVRDLGVPAKLVMHMAGVSDDGLNLELVGRQLGLKQNEHWCHHDHLFARGQGQFTEAQMVTLYNIADLYLTTTLGEGWGLGITEALACGTAIAVPGNTSCAEIMFELNKKGMREQFCPLPCEPHPLVQGLDNSRVRHRVSVPQAAAAIKEFYEGGTWRNRPGLNQPVREWLSWDRIAREMRHLMKGSK